MKNFKAHILIVDDDDRIRDLVKEYLNQNNYLVSTAKDSNDAFEKTKIIKFDLIVLDIMMPGKTGLEFTQDYKNKINTPILLLTAKGEPSERIEGLEVGADDYLTKPFEPKELLLRIKNITKNNNKLRLSSKYNIGAAQIDLKKMNIVLNQKNKKINNSEKKVLQEMLSNPGKIFTREEIGKISGINQERSIDVMITRLRQKLENDPKNPKYLQTIRGEGYVLWIE
mgnify:CR=1 FL=1